MKKAKPYLFGLAIGFINALFGAGGGMLAVPYLRSQGLSQKQSQATTICIILPLTVLSCAVYLLRGYVTLSDALPLLPLSVLGAAAGTALLKKAKNNVLKKFFALFMLWAGFRMVTK